MANRRASAPRIACLLPSATEICIALGLADNIVGVTHECNVRNVRAASSYGYPSSSSPVILTQDGLAAQTKHHGNGCAISSASPSQRDIHEAVSASQQQQRQQQQPPSSLYPILPDAWKRAAPTICLTQDLCSVCAPTSQDVRQLLLMDEDGKDKSSKTNDNSNGDEYEDVTIVSLKPNTLREVADTFVTVAAACGVPERGTKLCNQFLDELDQLKTAVESNRDQNQPRPSVVLLEWLDPPMDGGHWIPEMMRIAGAAEALPKRKGELKSQTLAWTTLRDANPDTLLVACCGFDLKRNEQDAQRARPQLSLLSSYTTNSIYAADGNTYFACPGPNLVGGAAIMARCAYAKQPRVLRAIEDLLSSSSPSSSSSFPNPPSTIARSKSGFNRVRLARDDLAIDVEDCVTKISSSIQQDFCTAHDEACAAGKLSYIDPDTGYSVFTELAHKKRGACCGSGCRHCPFHHENVRDKTSRIQQPALLYNGGKQSNLFPIAKHDRVKVLFWSGGKDSFLALRALVRQNETEGRPFGFALMTTFDASSRIIAHQDISIEDVVRQARHLDITLLGIPMHRNSREPYVDRIRRGLSVLESQLDANLVALVFGDLHLGHIKEWRDEELGKIGLDLEYPLWKVPYLDLMNDLEESRVTFQLSASTKEELTVGTIFCRKFFDNVQSKNIDGFGENGEFHTIAEVWDIDREVALGLKLPVRSY